MATRAIKKLDFAHIETYTVAAGQTCTAGKTVKHSGADDQIQDAGANSDLAIGVALGTPGTVYAAAAKVQVALMAPVVPMLVGTGGTTRGKKQKVVADGVTDAIANGGGTTDVQLAGIAMQSGVAGDYVGVLQNVHARVTA